MPGAKGCPGIKLTSVLAGMQAGADTIDDLDVLRHGAMGKLFAGVRAPSTLGTFLRSFRFGHVRQLDAVSSRAIALLAGRVAGQVLVRADSAYYQQALIAAIIKAGCEFSIGARLNKEVRANITTIDDTAWIPIVYPNAIVDPDTGELISSAEVAEITYTAFTSSGTKGQVTGRLIVRRVPERNTTELAAAAQDGLFQVWRYHAVFTNQTTPLVKAEKTHGGHAIIEQVFADLKADPLAHLPSKSFNANAAWLALATIAFNLTRALGVTAEGRYARAETATIRAQLIHTPARIATSARKGSTAPAHPLAWARSWQQLWTTIMTT